ncbi:MAG: TRAP transporter substrate-binding protein DctP [Syntrophobacteraceae bacterium]
MAGKRNGSRRLFWRLLTVLAVLVWAQAAWGAGEVTIKAATLIPQGSEWHRIIQEMGAEWQKISNGRVVFRLYPGGVAGDDMDLVRKMRLGTIDAGLLTVSGLSAIDRSVLSMEIPLAYADDREFDCVLERMAPQLERQFETKGFIVLGWTEGGWARFFTKYPVRTPDDMKKLKMFIWAGDDRYTELWKKAGFNPVPLPATEISTALQTGLVNAVTSNTQGVLLLQWYKQVKYMTEFKWAMLMGGIVMSKSAWEKIPAEFRPAIRESALKACRRFREFSRQSEPKDLEVLRKQGLEVVPVSEDVLDQWRAIIDGVIPQVRGIYVSVEFLDPALKQRDQCRKSAAGKK